ncbi:hypothetical protein PENSPDRAFT_695134 [Peniophora sp. CONT]|nr:hypothetical protein PENSPDRAFT_695134 [Peniophora sp. CONT]
MTPSGALSLLLQGFTRSSSLPLHIDLTLSTRVLANVTPLSAYSPPPKPDAGFLAFERHKSPKSSDIVDLILLWRDAGPCLCPRITEESDLARHGNARAGEGEGGQGGKEEEEEEGRMREAERKACEDWTCETPPPSSLAHHPATLDLSAIAVALVPGRITIDISVPMDVEDNKAAYLESIINATERMRDTGSRQAVNQNAEGRG